MSRIDDQVKPWALPLIVGRGKALHETGQCLLSQWAILKTLVADAAGKAHERVIHQRFYDALYAVRDTLEVPATFEVFVAQFGGGRLDIVHLHSLDDDRPLARDDIYTASFTIDRLAFNVFGRDPDGLIEFRHPRIQPAIRRIAPYGGSFVFPPGPALNTHALEIFMGTNVLR
jgi:hypothetical protein